MEEEEKERKKTPNNNTAEKGETKIRSIFNNIHAYIYISNHALQLIT